MVQDFNIPPYFEWLPGALSTYLITLGFLALTGLILSFLISAVRNGPMKAGDRIYKVVVSAGVDLARFSPKRVFALARLAVQESVRRRVWVALVVFGVILLFAGWFLEPSGDQADRLSNSDPGKLYINFVLTGTTFLVMLLALFLSAFSLPTDIKNHTIYTIVTKPVRTGEIVLGRILGFTVIGTVMLAVMGAASYLFVGRMLDHTHELTAADLREIPPDPGMPMGGKEGRTALSHNHFHEVTLDAQGNGVTDVRQGHFHRVHAETKDGQTRYIVGPPEDQLVARVPIPVEKKEDFRFLDRSGVQGPGINIGKEWAYRKFLDGGSPMAAIWTFSGITKERFAKGLPLEMNLRVFRTYKGEIADEKKGNRTVGILGSIRLQNPDQPRLKSIGTPFTAKDQVIDKHFIPPVLDREVDGQYKPVGLFKDSIVGAPASESLVTDDGRVDVVLQCLSPSQYLGVANADVYLKLQDGSFAWNFCKGYVSIWLQMLLVIGFGVMFSTFLGGPIAMLATAAMGMLGFFTEDVGNLFRAVIRGETKLFPGGGPLESMIRIAGQNTITLDLEKSLGVRVVQAIDAGIMVFMKAAVDLVPSFKDFDNIRYIADGFDIPAVRLLEQATVGFGFILALFLVGHLFLRMREVAN